MTDFPKTAGIIAEYNPFHSGHAFHLRETRMRTGASYIIAVMSGDFVQRGVPAIYDKYLRTRMALVSGADLVLELPPAFAVSSAEDFASCAVSLLDQLGVVSHICFGSECGDIKGLTDLADLLLEEPAFLSKSIKEFLSAGCSYPKALEAALNDCFPAQKQGNSGLSLLSGPNNTLGIEYIKALRRRGSAIIPVTIPRIGAGYNDQELAPAFSSASAIRKTILKQNNHMQSSDTLLSGQIPRDCLELIKSAAPVCADDFSVLLSYRLLELQQQNISPEIFADVSPELCARIQKQILRFTSFQSRITALKTKQYTYTRLCRCLLHILLHITAEDVLLRKHEDYCSYVRILGFRKNAAPLLRNIKKASKLPLITKTADASKILPPHALEHFQRDLFCSHIYQSVLEQKSGVCPENEYTHSVIVV